MGVKKIRVGLFGGSFNPIHNAHITVIKKILDEHVVNEMWTIPCKDHPFSKSLAPAKDRLEMIVKATRDLPQVKVSRIEMDREGKSYTLDTIRELKKKYNHTFYFLIGGDILSELHKWHDYKELLKETEFIVFKRPGYRLEDVPGLKICHVVESVSDISSTQIREQVQRGEPIDVMVPAGVEKYIRKHGLYRLR